MAFSEIRISEFKNDGLKLDFLCNFGNNVLGWSGLEDVIGNVVTCLGCHDKVSKIQHFSTIMMSTDIDHISFLNNVF